MDVFDDGILNVCVLQNQAANGMMPKPKLMLVKRYYFQDMLVSFNRVYAARGVNEQIDRLVRIWQDKSIRIGMYAVIGNEQFRITNVGNLFSNDGLKVTEITLLRLENNYDFDSEIDGDQGCPYSAD